ncbi:MAG: diguanylate cyclase [Nitrospirae bacterium]|nr:diguanylate cyclase [Nitrospirota bacterium]
MPRILLIDNGTSPVRNFEKSLTKKKYELINARDTKTALRFLKNNAVDMIVIDLDSPSAITNSAGFRDNVADTPKIYLLGEDGPYDKTLWLKDQYAVPVRGPLSFTEFLSWAVKLLNIKALRDENSALKAEVTAKQEKIEEISLTDDLTGLYNIRFLNQSIDIEMERSHRFGSIFSLIFMDIDDLKKVNDRFGHLTGSRVLIETAHVLQENLRKVDIIIRYGGDEFVIIMPQTSKDSGFMVANRLRKTIEERVFLKDEKHPVRITASFGIASFPVNAKNKEELLVIADKALYHGKFSTKNVVFAAE